MATLERLQILVTPEQKRWLEAESARRGDAVTAIVRDAIDAARSRRSLAQRAESLTAMQRMWATARPPAVSVSPADLNRLIDESRLADAGAGLPAADGLGGAA